MIDKTDLRKPPVHQPDLTENLECGKKCKRDTDCEDGEKCGGKTMGCKEAKRGYGQCKKGKMTFLALLV